MAVKKSKDDKTSIKKETSTKSKTNSTKEQQFCLIHKKGPFNKDSIALQNHQDETKEECQLVKHNPKIHNTQYKKAHSSDKYKFYFTDGSAQITQDVLDTNIQNLRPITLLDDQTRMILVYLPTKQEITKGTGDKTTTTYKFINSAYFVICDGNTGKRKILPYNNKHLVENYRIRILSEWNDIRWNVSDSKKWLVENKKTDPKELYNLIDSTTRKYLEFATEPEYIKFNLWNVSTYFFELFEAFPYNDFTGMKKAGKSKSLLFQQLVCFNSVMSADITSAATFRIIEGIGATLLLDETESFKDKKNDNAQAVRTLLMQGFLRNQYAVRNDTTKDNNFTPTQYNLYSPKSMAHISTFDDVLEERCIQQVQRRALNQDVLNNWCSEQDKSFAEIRNLCYRLFLDYADEINKLKDEARKLLQVNSRELQLWTPLITLALFFEKHGIPNLVSNIKLAVSQTSENRQINDEQETKELRVLLFLDKTGVSMAQDKNHIGNNPLGWISITELYHQLNVRSTEYEIPEWYARKHLTESLTKLGFKQEKKEGGYSWFITRNAVDEVKKRMGVNDRDTKLDDFKGSLGTSSGCSDASDTSGTGTKTTSNEKSSDLETSVTSDSKTDSRRKTEQTEETEANARKQDHSSSRYKSEQTEVSEVSKNSKSSVTSDSSGSTVSKIKSYSKKRKSSKSFYCKDCNFGNFINLDSKSILDSTKTYYDLHKETHPKHKLEFSDEVIP